MRIIAGKYGGRRLSTFKADHIRPTTDRVKESLFNKLQGGLEGARVLDLFAGTGNLSFEALSRGATSVDSVEMSKASVAIINKNKKILGVGNELTIHLQDVLKFLKNGHQKYDVIFIDPPFTKKMAHSVLEALSKSDVFLPHSEVFIESSTQESVLQNYPPLRQKSHKAFGDKYLSHYVFG